MKLDSPVPKTGKFLILVSLLLTGSLFLSYDLSTHGDDYETVRDAKNSHEAGNNVYMDMELESGNSMYIARYAGNDTDRYDIVVNYSDKSVRSFDLSGLGSSLLDRTVSKSGLELNNIETKRLLDSISRFESGEQIVYDCSGDRCTKRFIDNWFLRTNDWYPHQNLSAMEGANRSDVANVSLMTDAGNYVQAPVKERYRLRSRPVDLEQPWDIDELGNGDLLVTQSVGRLSRIDPETWEQENISFRNDYKSHDTTGLLGIETLQKDGQDIVYLYYTYDKGDFFRKHRVSSFILVDGELRNETVLVDSIPGSKWHSGGRLDIGPDNRLYITTGDANTMLSAGDDKLLAGKILRVNLDGTIPEGNPGKSPIFIKGLRNPQGLAWQPGTDKLFITEHGLVHNDAVRVGAKGDDLGWPIQRCGINYLEKYSINYTSISSVNESYRGYFDGYLKFRDSAVNRSGSKDFCTGNWTIAPSGAAYISGTNSDMDGELLVAGMRGKHIHHFEIENGKIIDNYVGGFRDIGGHSGRYRHVEQIGDSIYVLGKYNGMYQIPT